MMRNLLTILIICFLMVAPVLAQEAETQTNDATNWGPLVFMLGFAIIAATGWRIFLNSQDTQENGK